MLTLSEQMQADQAWIYFWDMLPWAIPSFFTFLISLSFVGIGFFALKRFRDKVQLIAFMVFCLGYASYGLLLASRSLIVDKEVLLFWNRLGYLGFTLITPAAALLSYTIMNRRYKILLGSFWLGIAIEIIVYWAVFTGNDLKNEWFEYSFGNYPIGKLPLKIWASYGIFCILGLWIPSAIFFYKQDRKGFLDVKYLSVSLIAIGFLLILTSPSLLGYPVYPVSTFSFVPLLVMGYGLFHSDFLNINELLFKQQFLFKILNGIIIVGLILLSALVAIFLPPSEHIVPYQKPYFLIPLFSMVCVFALGIYIAGSRPDQKINMIAASSLLLAGSFTIVMVVMKLSLPDLVSRRIEQIFYTAFVFTPNIHIRLCYLSIKAERPRYFRYIDFISFILCGVVWTPYFFGGFFQNTFGKISEAGIGLQVFGVQGAIAMTLLLLHWKKLGTSKTDALGKYVVYSILLGDLMIISNLPATLGYQWYTIGELQFLPAIILAVGIIKFGIISIRGEATKIASQMSLLILLFVLISMSFYWMNLAKTFTWLVALSHTLLVSSPIALAFYMVSFIFFRPTVVKIDQSVLDLAAQKVETERAFFEAEAIRKEIQEINHLTHLINSQLNIKMIVNEIAKYVLVKHGIKTLWLFLPDEQNKSLKSFEIDTIVEAKKEAMEFAKNLVIPLSEEGGIAYSVWMRKNSLYLPKIKKFAFDFDRKIIENTGAKSILHIPLVVQDKSVGLFTFSNSTEEMRLSRKEITSLENLCAQVAGVINRVYLLRETEKQKADTTALNQLLKSLNENIDLDVIMEKVHQYVSENFGIEYYSLLLPEEGKDYLRIVNVKIPEFVSEFDKKRLLDMKIPTFGRSGAHSMVLRSKKVVFFTQGVGNFDRLFSEDDQFGMGALKLKHIIFIPMVLRGKIIGVLDLSNSEKELRPSEEDLTRLSILGEQLAGIIYISKLFKELQIAKELAENEKRKNEKLLLNILPAEIAEELKEKGATEPILYENVSVMFTDFKGFTQIAETLSPQELIRDLDACFIQFDKITERYKLEKLKTIGDSYMCAGGIPKRNKTHAIDSVLAALEIQSFMNLMKQIKEEQGFPFWELRLGIHSGPLVAGVIGEKKFAYDVWGDTVNTASRMESSGQTGKINISGTTYDMVKEYFDCEFRGQVSAKNKGEVAMYYVNGLKAEFSSSEDFRIPNQRFWEEYAKIDGSFESVA
ncbi:adenylate/guanylate cyclase catalytic domain protein [Leptospira ryugenii]|uniref:Adenylate cyclase n=1 Tax=Leptospira ryugenii TaxID=1917863 RepID=A0A2P2DZP3_9LEPT|nr:adenylate/guanylate cyclase domain-containing protein [Leptospira ryugenii]GBF50099.1 adenylate/guanylate cyclase catalytic domain protein [Leptospira ryugenii]